MGPSPHYCFFHGERMYVLHEGVQWDRSMQWKVKGRGLKEAPHKEKNEWKTGWRDKIKGLL